MSLRELSFKEFMMASELALLAVSAGLFPAGVIADDQPVQEAPAPTVSNERAPASTAEAPENAINPETDTYLKNAGTQVEKVFEEGSQGE